MRKITMHKNIVILVFALLALSLGGCGGHSSAEAEDKTLTLAVYEWGSNSSRSELKKHVDWYNENNGAVKIEILNYYDTYPDYTDAQRQLKIEITAGKGPDMINFGGGWSYSPLEASSGILIDLYPLMNEDPSFSRQDFFENILDAFAIGESLYVLAPTFDISSFTTTCGALAALDKMTIEELVQAYNARDEGAILFPGETKRAVFAMLLSGSVENYIDWGESSCRFDSDSFMELLLFADQFPLHLNIANDYSAKEVFQENRAILFPTHIANIYDMAKSRVLFGQTPNYIGYPLDAGNGNMADISDIAIGIAANCQDKAEAWEFLRSLLDNEFQENTESGLPLRISALEARIEAALETEHDKNGEKVTQARIVFEGEDDTEIYEITAEDAEALLSVISKITLNRAYDYPLLMIIMEEADYMFGDSRNAMDTASIIQNRVSIYIKEGK